MLWCCQDESIIDPPHLSIADGSQRRTKIISIHENEAVEIGEVFRGSTSNMIFVYNEGAQSVITIRHCYVSTIGNGSDSDRTTRVGSGRVTENDNNTQEKALE